MRKIILVTGATSGIGKAIAEKFASKGCKVIINGRRIERLENLKNDLQKKYNSEVYPLAFDVRDKKAVFESIENLPDEWKDIDILINNAGLALGTQGIQNGDIDDWETMIDTNVKGLLYVTKALLPIFLAKHKGHIVNVGSTASKETYPGGNVYCASKHAVQALSEGFSIDLAGNGIKVSQISPGMTDTEFSLVRYKGDQQAADNVYRGMKPLIGFDVAEIAYFITMDLPEHVCVRDILVTSQQQANSYIVSREK